jgi:hypothetical protein
VTLSEPKVPTGLTSFPNGCQDMFPRQHSQQNPLRKLNFTRSWMQTGIQLSLFEQVDFSQKDYMTIYTVSNMSLRVPKRQNGIGFSKTL